MNFNDFVEEVTGNIKLFLPEDYMDAEITVTGNEKLNETYWGMMVRKEDQSLSSFPPLICFLISFCFCFLVSFVERIKRNSPFRFHLHPYEDLPQSTYFSFWNTGLLHAHFRFSEVLQPSFYPWFFPCSADETGRVNFSLSFPQKKPRNKSKKK